MSDHPYSYTCTCADCFTTFKRRCPCGSGLDKEPQYDGHAIFLCYTCDECHASKMAGFRPDIRERYEADEAIEPEEYYGSQADYHNETCDDVDDGEPKCTAPRGHKWVVSDENENVVYCENCGCPEY